MTKCEMTQACTQISSQASTSKDNCDEKAVTSMMDDVIFDPDLLRDIDMSSCAASFYPPLSVSDPGEGLRLRPLRAGDFRLGFLQLLAQLTSVGEVSEDQWQRRFSDMKRKSGTYNVMVLEDTDTKQIIGAATLLVEEKFIHKCSQVGRIEDVVVSDQYRGRQLGKFLVTVSVLLAAKLGCYKVTLNCKDEMTKFYNGIGFKCEEGDANFMVIRL